MYIHKICSMEHFIDSVNSSLQLFPFFSNLITTLIAIDRLLRITKHYKYKTLVKRGRLKVIVGFAFILSVVYTSLAVYCGIYTCNYRNNIYRLLPVISIALSVCVVVPCIVFVAYMCILCYVYRCSNVMSHRKVSGKNSNKKFTKTIMLILVSQIIFALPFTSLNLSLAAEFFNDSINLNFNVKLYSTLHYWLFILWNCQFFVNGMIFLINQREHNQKKRECKKDENKIQSGCLIKNCIA